MASSHRDALQYDLKKKKICRFCLSQDARKLTNIYMRDTRIKSSAPLPIQIMAIASIEVFSNDDMPSFVCSDCTDMFEFSYQFKQMCKKADNLLRQFPLTAKYPGCLEKPIIQTSMLPKKILNSAVNSKGTAPAVVFRSNNPRPQPEQDTKVIAFLDKIENNDEISLDDIHELVAAEDKSAAEFVNVENNQFYSVPASQPSKPKLLNKSSIRILNKEADQENEPRLSLPKINKDVDGKTEVVAEILNLDDAYEDEPDPNMADVIETNVFPCELCERTFPLLQLRDIHMKNHLRDRKFKCDNCEKSFFSKYDLQRHSFTHNGEKPYKCTVCDKGFSRATLLSRHEKNHTDVPKHICVYCERSFLSKDDMEKHVERHNINRPFVCKICNKGFAFKQGVERHEIVHSRQQPYVCHYCDESFSTTTKLSRHLTAHAGRRPYPCKYCKKSYLLSHHLTRHLRSHKNVDVNSISFMCIRCNTDFTTRDELIRHSATHASEMNLGCPLCGDIFDSIKVLTSHIQEHSEGEAFACEFCDLIFITPEKLQLHTDLDHINEMEAYHADDLAQASKEKERKLSDIVDEKLQTTVNEILADELPCEENDSDFAVTIKTETEVESPKIINQIIIQSHNDDTEGDHHLVIPLKQRKLDLADENAIVKQSKVPEKATQSPIIRRKLPNARGIQGIKNIDPKQPNINSLLKSNANISKMSTSKISTLKNPSPKTPQNKTPPTKISPSTTVQQSKKTTVMKSEVILPIPKIIKVEKDPLVLPSSSATHVDDDNVKNKMTKKVKIQKITVTKAQAAAMAKEGRIKIKDGQIILKK